MIKSILKEIIITLLLCIAILLVLGILFYDYNPLNKVVPDKIAYTTPENIQNELNENKETDIWESENIVYSIEGKDLNIYMKNNSYVSGKQNPFQESYGSDTVDEEQVNGQTVSTNNGNTQETQNVTNTINKTNSNPDSTGTFLNTTGK